jgi:microsomal epoxide hydrolase
LEAGSGPTIIFIPGWTMPAHIWELQLEHFSKRYRFVALDPRSQGDSDKPAQGNYPERRAQDIKELIEHLGDAPVVAAGWSTGMTELLTYVDLFGTRHVSAFVLVDTFIVKPPWFQRDVLKLAHQLERDRAAAMEAYVRWMFKKPQSESYISSLVNASLKTPVDTAVALLASFLAQDDWRPTLGKIDKPLLYVAEAVLKLDAEMLQSIVPAARVEIFDEAGHALFVEEVTRFNSMVDNFVRDSLQK